MTTTTNRLPSLPASAGPRAKRRRGADVKRITPAARVVDLCAYRQTVEPREASQTTDVNTPKALTAGVVLSIAERGAKYIALRHGLVRTRILDVTLDAECPPVACVAIFLCADGTRRTEAVGVEPEFAQILAPELDAISGRFREHARRLRPTD